jgi:predicted dehydrogenase
MNGINEPIKWGILGLGNIARKFAEDLALCEDAELKAVGSRSLSKSNDFGKNHSAKCSYGSYQELVDDPEVQVVYIATPHVYHAELTHLCLDHGKAVLCEKPFAMGLTEVEGMISKAKDKNLFLMEALWTRFIPGFEKVLSLIEEGTIGTVERVHADFGFVADFDPDKRLFNKELGGGALLDIGIYPLYLSLATLGMPVKIDAKAVFSETGVDAATSMLLTYEGGYSAILDCTLKTNTQVEGWIHGSKGSIKMHSRFHHPTNISILTDGKSDQLIEIPFIGNGYFHEIEEVNDCLRQGAKQSEKMNHQNSLDLMSLLDQVRAQIGLHY